jgi:hypothetical protein
MKFTVVLMMLACMALSVLGATREIKQKVASMDPKIKSSVLGMKAQGMPTHVIADKIKMSVKHDGNMQHIVNGITEEANRKRSPAAVEAKKRSVERNQAIKQQQRADKRKRDL